jgi:hypothetical protein
MVPFFDGKPKLVHALMKLMKLDNVNYLHHRNLNTPGAAFVRGLLDDFHITMRVDGADVLNNLPEGAFSEYCSRLVCFSPMLRSTCSSFLCLLKANIWLSATV